MAVKRKGIPMAESGGRACLEIISGDEFMKQVAERQAQHWQRSEFHWQCEFYTTRDGRHRVEIYVRDGYPNRYERSVCDVLARLLAAHAPPSGFRPQIVSLFHDDTYGNVTIWVGSTDPAQFRPGLASRLSRIIEGPTLLIEWELFLRGNEMSDHYNHAAYLYRQHLIGKALELFQDQR
jgi:hypothetical protein